MLQGEKEHNLYSHANILILQISKSQIIHLFCSNCRYFCGETGKSKPSIGLKELYNPSLIYILHVMAIVYRKPN